MKTNTAVQSRACRRRPRRGGSPRSGDVARELTRTGDGDGYRLVAQLDDIKGKAAPPDLEDLLTVCKTRIAAMPVSRVTSESLSGTCAG